MAPGIPFALALAGLLYAGEIAAAEHRKGLVGTIVSKAGGGGEGMVPTMPLHFQPGEPMRLVLILRNEGDRSWCIEERETNLPHTFIVRDSKGRTLTSIRRVGYDWYPVRAKRIQPGETLNVGVDLLDLYPPVIDPGLGVHCLLTPGTYSVQVVLRSPVQQFPSPPEPGWPADLWPSDVVSNTLHFRVLELSEDSTQRWLGDIAQVPPEERVRRIQVLGAARARGAVQALAALARSDPSVTVRIAAIQALMCLGDTSPVETIEHILQQDTSPRARAYAAALLGEWGLPSSVPALLNALKNRNPGVVDKNDPFVWYSAVVRALGDIGDPRAIPALEDIAKNDPAGWVREGAKSSIDTIKKGGRRSVRKDAAAVPAVPPPGAGEATTTEAHQTQSIAVALGLSIAVFVACVFCLYLRRARRKPGDKVA